MRRSSDREDAPHYVLVESDRYEADRDKAILSVNRLLGPQAAGDWPAGCRGLARRLPGTGPQAAGDWAVALARTVNALPDFPGPLSHARDEEASAHYSREVRRMLFYGPTKRRSGTPIRVLFTLLPPAPDDPPETAETVIFLLRLLHGPQSLTSDTAEP